MRPATRSRLRPWLLLAVLMLTAIYFFTGPRSSQTSDFYTRTVAAMDAHRKTSGGDSAAVAQAEAEAKVRSGAGGEIVLEKVPDHEGGKGEQVSHKLGSAAAAAKENSPPKAGSAAGQEPLSDDEAAPLKPKLTGKVNDKVYEKDAGGDAVHGPPGSDKLGKPRDSDDGVAKLGNTGKQASDSSVLESPGARQVSGLLDEILKKSPVIIFSKSYCPYSKKAKRILLQDYKIVPAPYVHEIDQMDESVGSALQAKLFEVTKRRTVPNVLVNGVSVGGGDDIEALDAAGALAEKFSEIGGKRIMEVTRIGTTSPPEGKGMAAAIGGAVKGVKGVAEEDVKALTEKGKDAAVEGAKAVKGKVAKDV